MKRRTPLHDKTWRLNHVYSIVDKEGNRRSLSENLVQQAIRACPEQRKMVLKARQFGVSTGCIIDQFDDTIHIPNLTSCIIAHEQDAIKKLFRIVHRGYHFLDPELKPVIDRGGGSKYEFFFPILNSRIYCDLEVRGDTIHRLHVSEAHFIKDDDKIKATLQAVPLKTGRVTLESTPNGIGGLFYDMWMDPDQPYAKLFFPWFIFPEYEIETDPLKLTPEEKEFIKKAKRKYGVTITHSQIAFRRYKQRELGSLFIQEYPEDDQECFLSSGSAAMNLFLVRELSEKARAPIYQDEKTTLFVPYNNGHLYACGVDTSEGVGGDPSVAEMFDVRTREQVGELVMDRAKPHDFAHEVYEFCERFTEPGRPFPLLGVERNNHGHAVLLALDDILHYPNLYYRPIGDDRDERPGWVTDRVTRPLMIDTFIDGVEHQTLKLNSRGLFTECLTLVNNDGKIEAAEGKHDDRVVAASIGLQMAIECGLSDVYDNIQEKIRT